MRTPFFGPEQSRDHQFLCVAFFLGNSLLINVLGDAGLSMTQDFLRHLEWYSFLAAGLCHPVTERMPRDHFSGDVGPYQRCSRGQT